MFEWDAFWLLSSDRSVGMSAGAIHWSSVSDFATRYGICDEDFERFVGLIRAMDEAYRDYHKGKE